MAGVLSLALVVTLAVILVGQKHAMIGACTDNWRDSGSLMDELLQEEMESNRCGWKHWLTCGEILRFRIILRKKICLQLKDHFESFINDLRLCRQSPPTPPSPPTTATPPPATTTTATPPPPPPPTTATATPTTTPSTTTPTTTPSTTTTPTTTPTTTTTATTPPGNPRDCKDVYDRGNTGDRVTEIFPDGETPVSVRCIKGATIFLNRESRSGDYDLSYAEYEKGFGDRKGDYYLGNKALYDLTRNRNYKAVIDLTYNDRDKRQAVYSTFRVAGPDDWYRLTIGNFSGNAENKMGIANGERFTARDNYENRSYQGSNVSLGGAFWWRASAPENDARLTVTVGKSIRSQFLWGTTNASHLKNARISLVNL